MLLQRDVRTHLGKAIEDIESDSFAADGGTWLRGSQSTSQTVVR